MPKRERYKHTGVRERLHTLGQRVTRAAYCLKKTVRELRACLRSDEMVIPKSEEVLLHLTSLLDSVTTGIISLDGDGNIRVFNAGAETLFDLPRSKVLGLPFSDAGHLLRRDERSCNDLWERLSDAVWAAGAARDLEYDLVPRSSPKRVISYSVYPLGRTSWSLDNGVVIVLEDITRKKEMEDQISDARKRLQAVFDGITDGIQVVDSDFRVTAVNKSMTALLQRTITVGNHCFKTCVFGVRICTDCPAAKTFQTGLPAFTTKKLDARPFSSMDGGERVVEISTFPLVDRANRVIQVVEYIKDVTERVSLAESLEHSRRLAELGEMAARVAHEVRNPLNAITGAAHFLLTEYEADDTIQKFTSLINRQAGRVNQVASDLLALSRPMRLDTTDVNVNAVMEQSLDTLCSQIRIQNVVVKHEMAKDIPYIRADELQIEQVMQNIIRNAIEAMPGGGELHVSTGVAGDGKSVEVIIQDTGQGIAEKDRERIFQTFFTTKVKGTGLGLAIVQRVLKNHGGEIQIEQPEISGTKVFLRLPVHPRSGAGMQSRTQERAEALPKA